MASIKLVPFLYVLFCIHAASSQNVYRSWSTKPEPCSALLKLDSVHATLRQLLRSDSSKDIGVLKSISVGLVELRNMTIIGLEKAQLSGSLNFQRLETNMPNYFTRIRIGIPLKFDFLDVKALMRLRYTNSAPREMEAFVQPTEIVVELDFREAYSPIGMEISDEPLAYVNSVKITHWQGIRVSGRGIWLRLFRLIHGKNQLDKQIRSSIESTIHKQLNKVLNKYRPSNLVEIIFNQWFKSANHKISHTYANN